jgi:apolipoprotein D and lipocalin family protein
MMNKRRVALVLAALVSITPASSGADPLPLPKVEMERIYGGWYMIATLPNWFERGIVAPYDVYSKRPDGDLQEDFTFKPGSFAAPSTHYTVHDWVLPNTNNAQWRVQVFWPLALPFLVLWVDPEYRYVIFGEADRKLGWIFSRTQDIPEADYSDLLRRFSALGYDSGKLVKFVQRPEQIGKPGYWSDGVKP